MIFVRNVDHFENLCRCCCCFYNLAFFHSFLLAICIRIFLPLFIVINWCCAHLNTDFYKICAIQIVLLFLLWDVLNRLWPAENDLTFEGQCPADYWNFTVHMATAQFSFLLVTWSGFKSPMKTPIQRRVTYVIGPYSFCFCFIFALQRTEQHERTISRVLSCWLRWLCMQIRQVVHSPTVSETCMTATGKRCNALSFVSHKKVIIGQYK